MPDKCFPHFQSDTDTVIPVSVVRRIPPGQCRAALHLFWNDFPENCVSLSEQRRRPGDLLSFV